MLNFGCMCQLNKEIITAKVTNPNLFYCILASLLTRGYFFKKKFSYVSVFSFKCPCFIPFNEETYGIHSK